MAKTAHILFCVFYCYFIGVIYFQFSLANDIQVEETYLQPGLGGGVCFFFFYDSVISYLTTDNKT